MSNTNPTVNYVRYNKKKTKGGKPPQQQTFGNSMDLELCLQTANQMLMENSKPKVKFVIDVGKANINGIRNVPLLMDSVTNVQRKDILQ